MPSRNGFTLIELLVVIAIIAVLAVVVVLTLNPAGLLQESRDSNRLSDMATLTSAIGLSLADNASESLGSPNVIYASVPDPVATSSQGDQCQGLGLPALPASFFWHCAASSTFRKTDGTGWIPISLTTNTFGSSLSQLPLDPINTTSSRLFYAYATNGQQFEVTTPFESQKLKLGGSGDKIAGDGGTLASLYEKGSRLGLMPLDYGDLSLVRYWPFSEGAGTTAYDYAGSNDAGTLSGAGATWTSGGMRGPFALHLINPGNITFVTSSSLPTSAVTVIAWINESTHANWNNYLNNNWGGPSGGWLLFGDSGGGVFFGVWSGGSQYDASGCSAQFTTGSWHLLAGTYNGQTVSSYLDGNLCGTTNLSGQSLYAGGLINAGVATLGVYSMNNVRVYNRALTQAQIQALYNGGK